MDLLDGNSTDMISLQEDVSLLHCVVNGTEDVTSFDGLMTMLIAGHEMDALCVIPRRPGTAAQVSTQSSVSSPKQRGLDGDEKVALCSETLRLYPEPSVLIRRARKRGLAAPSTVDGVRALQGTDIFLLTWNWHRNPELWETH